MKVWIDQDIPGRGVRIFFYEYSSNGWCFVVPPTGHLEVVPAGVPLPHEHGWALDDQQYTALVEAIVEGRGLALEPKFMQILDGERKRVDKFIEFLTGRPS